MEDVEKIFCAAVDQNGTGLLDFQGQGCVPYSKLISSCQSPKPVIFFNQSNCYMQTKTTGYSYKSQQRYRAL